MTAWMVTLVGVSVSVMIATTFAAWLGFRLDAEQRALNADCD